MNRYLTQFIIMAFAMVCRLSMLSSCNKEDEETGEEQADPESLAYYSSTEITSFSLKNNSKILPHLDSVFFSIDLVDAQIYNADSLPYGTDVSRMLVNVGVKSSSALEIVMKSRFTDNDTTVNLLENPNDSINFAPGHVTLRITSQDGKSERMYTVKLNVHKVVADSLTWTGVAGGRLPGATVGPTAQKTVSLGQELLCLTTDGTSASLASSTDPFEPDAWASSAVTLPEGADVNSFTATSDALYILTATGDLMRSADKAATWTVADTGWSHIYGGFMADVVGVKGNTWTCYPGGASGTLSAQGTDFPVAGTSQLVEYSNEWSDVPQAMMVGGITAAGSLTGTSWCFDGKSWMCLTLANGSYSLPAAEGYTLFPYFTYKVNSSDFKITERSTWVALGGKSGSDGKMQTKVYTSWDSGIHWLTATANLHLPADVEPRFGAQAFVVPHITEASRAVAPITSWDTPYVYMFGGYDASSRLYDQLWRGVINRMTFKPLQ